MKGNNWKVVRLRIGDHEIFRVCRLFGHNIIYKGGVWTTESEAQAVSKELNDTESIVDDVFKDADSFERIERNSVAAILADFYFNTKVEDQYLIITDEEVRRGIDE